MMCPTIYRRLDPNPEPNQGVHRFQCDLERSLLSPLSRRYGTDSAYCLGQLVKELPKVTLMNGEESDERTVTIAIITGDLLSNGNGPENSESNVSSLTKKFAIIVAIVLS